MYVGADRIRPEALSRTDFSDSPVERSLAMPDVKDDATFPGFNHSPMGFARYCIDNATGESVIRVGIDVASPHASRAVIDGNGRQGMVDHQRQPQRLTGLQCTPVGFGRLRPSSAIEATGGFHAQKHIAILLDTIDAPLHSPASAGPVLPERSHSAQPPVPPLQEMLRNASNRVHPIDHQR